MKESEYSIQQSTSIALCLSECVHCLYCKACDDNTAKIHLSSFSTKQVLHIFCSTNHLFDISY